MEAESKLKQVYIPNYTKNAPPAVNAPKGMYNGNSNLNGGGDPICLSSSGKPCESCSTMQSPQVRKIKLFENAQDNMLFPSVVHVGSSEFELSTLL